MGTHKHKHPHQHKHKQQRSEKRIEFEYTDCNILHKVNANVAGYARFPLLTA